MSDFIIRLDKTSNSQTSYSFVVKDKFFETFTSSDIKHADIIVAVKLNKQGNNISANLKINGHINKLACDITFWVQLTPNNAHPICVMAWK